MQYHGKLYGKIGNKHFDTGKTAKDVDELVQMLEKILKTDTIPHLDVAVLIEKFKK
jgi:hypothetical protein